MISKQVSGFWSTFRNPTTPATATALRTVGYLTNLYTNNRVRVRDRDNELQPKIRVKGDFTESKRFLLSSSLFVTFWCLIKSTRKKY